MAVALLTPVAANAATEPLSFDNNWFVTGDYVTAGVGLRGQGGADGYATGTITLPNSLPTDAEPVAAFLYWSSVEYTIALGAADGYFNGNQIRGAIVGSATANPGCGSSGGTVGPGAYGRVYRADVLRYFPIGDNHIRQLKGVAATVKLRDSGGNGNGQLLYTNGATLLVIYRVITPGAPSVKPLRGVVAYDGAFTMPKGSSGISMNLAGFYQADTESDPGAKVTFIVANGQVDSQSPLYVNGDLIGASPFTGLAGSRWDSPTFNFALAPGAASFPFSFAPASQQTCLTVVAAVASMNVADKDKDGLLDIWESKGLHRNTTASPATFGGCSDFPSERCVDLPKMGAKPGQRDVFVQIDWMHGNGDGTGGTDGSGNHTHQPKLEALEAVCTTFAGHGIALHFDVGDMYRGIGDDYGAATDQDRDAACIMPSRDANGNLFKDGAGNRLAQGGSDIDESTLACHTTATHTCIYDQPYPVLSFGFGFASVRDGNTKAGISGHFDPARKDTHHYSLFAHALAGPFNSSGQPVDPYEKDPAKKILSLPATPRSYSCIANLPGGGFMVTLGLWRSDIPANDQVGSSLVQAGTLMHELGHNLGLGHAGLNTKPNCIPNYPSIMNYAYQTRGLTDATGGSHIDFSHGSLNNLSEGSLSSSMLLGSLQYRVRFFGPVGASSSAAAKVHCDGTPILDGALAVRLEGSAAGTPLAPVTPDWSNGTVTPGTSLSFDVNFDGASEETFSDSNDWSALNLQQIGSGSNFGGLSVGALATDAGVLATDGGALATDAGALATDGGVFATDGGAFATDAGAFATDGGVFATDGGALATDAGALATDAGDEDYETHNASGPDAPVNLTASNELSSIRLQWTPPGSGTVANYDIYRCAGLNCPPSLFVSGVVPASKAAPSYTFAVNDQQNAGETCDPAKTCFNTVYTYQVLANVASVVAGVTTYTASSLSNSASSKVTHLFVIASAQRAVYGGSLPATVTFGIYGDVQTAPPSLSVSCTYAAGAKNVGVYAITCSGPATVSATNGVTYNQAYLTYAPGALTIAARPITVAAAPNTKRYDGTSSAAAAPTITDGAIQPGDSANFVEAYLDKNAGSGKTLKPSGTVNDGNGGSNYSYTFVDNASGVISPAPLTITAAANTKTYDGTVSAAARPGFSGLQTGDTVTGLAEAYNDKNVGTGKTLNVSAYTLNDGNAGRNYAVTTVANVSGIINPAPLSITALDQTKFFGTPFTFLGTEFAVSGVLYSGDTVTTAAFACAGIPAGAAVGVYPIVPSGALGTGLTNYDITFINGSMHVQGFFATGSMATARSYHAAVLLPNGKVLVAGGLNSSGGSLASAELYDASAGTFRPTANNMPNKADHFTLTLLNSGKVLAAGGGNSSAQLYDPSTNVWSATGGMSAQRSNHTATLLPNGKVLIAGGSNGSGITLTTAQIFDPSTGGFTPTGNMTAARDFHTATLLPSGKVLIAGGRTGGKNSYSYLSSAEIYDPATGVFTAAGSMTAIRYGHTAALVNGLVLITGGGNATAEIYNPGDGTFSAKPSMATARQYFTATTLLNGYVLEAGGISGGASLQSAQEYQNGAFVSAGNMTAPRAAHTATLLSDGSVLVTGGQGAAGTSVGTAELFKMP